MKKSRTFYRMAAIVLAIGVVIGIVSDKRNDRGVAYVIHHNSPFRIACEEDILEKRDDMTAHYRVSR